jgi:hypothetical protein
MATYRVHIDAGRRRVMTTWGPTVDDPSLLAYQREVWSDAALRGFDEVIDFRSLRRVEATSAGLEAVATLAAEMDQGMEGSRFAIVVGDTLAFGLSRMYEALRGLNTLSRREVMVFEDPDRALAWLDEDRGASPSGQR